MPDTRRHRGPHPEDHRLFAESVLPALREASSDLSWLLTRGYSEQAAATIVGDKFQLTDRQRNAVRRSACSDQALSRRLATMVRNEAIGEIAIDGYNLLTTLESALSHAVVVIGRDGALRDIAGLRGTYRLVEETIPALKMVADAVGAVPRVCWYLDSPVSNSKKLAGVIRDFAEEKRLPWEVEVVQNPDSVLKESKAVVASADSQILDACERWMNFAAELVTGNVQTAFLVDLRAIVQTPRT